jgi:glycosyltransferase involved in cell wall biosynthesis
LEKFKNLDLIITPTPHLQGFFVRSGFSPEKVMLSGYGFNFDWVRPHSSHFPEQPLRFGYSGMLAQLKGVDTLIHAFNSLSFSKPACLKIYGDDFHFPLYAKKLKKLARNNPHITFPGTFSPDKRGEVLAEIDVLIVPSMWYGNAPLVVSEAFAAGVPVKGGDVPGISVLVKNGVNGLLFSRGDKNHLRRCFEKFLREPDLLTKLRKNSSPVKSIHENGNELGAIYYKLINNQTKTAPAKSQAGVTPRPTPI